MMNALKWKLVATGYRTFSVETISKSRVNTFNAGVWFQPHFQKVKKGGEDAASLSSNVIAVADGVGGWAESGIDPAVFSKKLCKNIDELIV
jgi:protein phosphatase PTC7